METSLTIPLTTVGGCDYVSRMTPKQMLLERLYPGHLAADVARLRGQGMSWRGLAKLVSEKCEYPVTHETLRAWYDPRPDRVAS